MIKLFQKQDRFFCFTPEVALATFLIEAALAFYVWWKYKLTVFGRLLAFIIALLALFQLSEYQVCSGTNQIFWARFGFAVITLLPVLGLHLISLVSGKKHFLKFGYTLMAAYILIFLFAPKAIDGATCAGNYIIFHTEQKLAWTYSAYYFGFLVLGIWEALENLRKNKSLLSWVIVGYASFMGPMAAVYLLAPQTRSAIPSIMCGFALLLAFILAFKIAPKSRFI